MASLFMRIREMMTAHAHDSLDARENPRVMANQVLRDLAEDVQRANRALVAALGARKSLEREQDAALRGAEEWDTRAERLLRAGNEPRARESLGRAVELRARAGGMTPALESAGRAVQRLQAQMQRLRDEWRAAQARCAIIEAQHTAAGAVDLAGRGADAYSQAMARGERLDLLSRKAQRLECEAEAAAELLDEGDRLQRHVADVDRDAAVDDALGALKARVAKESTPGTGADVSGQ